MDSKLSAILLPHLEQSEGCVNHLYLDTARRVTVGFGHAVRLADALALPFELKPGSLLVATGKAEIEDIVRQDYQAVITAPTGMATTAYAPLCQTVLPSTETADLFVKDLDAFDQRLHILYPNFDSWPITARAAVFDMAYNLGVTGMETKFPQFCLDIKGENWENAALHSNRIGIQLVRNQQVREWLQEAVAVVETPAESKAA
jgi:GH24 family phage-related lysozyme (muramidase)